MANVALNSELNLIFDQNKKVDEYVTLAIQFEDKFRKSDRFKRTENLWSVIEKLFRADFPEIYDDKIIYSIHYLQKKFEGKNKLQEVTLKSLGLSGHVSLRLNSRPIDQVVEQKYVENLTFVPFTESPVPQKCEPNDGNLNEKNDSFIATHQYNETVSLGPDQKKKETELKNLADSSLIESLRVQQKSDYTNETIKKPQESVKNESISNEFKLILLGGENYEVLYSLTEPIEFVEEVFTEEFFEHTPSDLRHLLAELRRQRNTEEILETEEQRQRKRKAERERYDRTILRIVFPYDKLVLQAIFKPDNIVADVINTVQKYTKTDNVIFFTTPPKNYLTENSNLYDCGLVPSGLIYCSETVESGKNVDPSQPIIRSEFRSLISSFKDATKYAIEQIKLKRP